MLAWIIYYDDGFTFSSGTGPPGQAPRTGVQCIAVADAGCGRYILSEQEYYCWHVGERLWIPHDISGLYQYLDRPGLIKIVLRGYWIGRQRHFEIRRKALKDDNGLPPVTAKPPRQPEGQL